MQGCSLIDDDLSNCGYDYKMVYKLRLITNMQTELDEVLHADADLPAKEEISRYLAPVFSDMAHDVDISFYTQPDDVRSFYKYEIIDDNRSEYVFYLPVENYMNLCVANLDYNEIVRIADTVGSKVSRLTLPEGTRFSPQRTGLFASRLPMQIQDTVGDQEFEVTLYMANCASVLVLDTAGCTNDGIRAEVRGTADEFMIADSTYSFSRKVVVDAENTATARALLPGRMPLAQSVNSKVCFAAVSFPSADTADAEGNYWEMAVYVSLSDGTVTETLLTAKAPLNAGHVKIIRAKLDDKGRVSPVGDSEMGAQVTLDWKEGGTYNPTL